MLQVIMLVSYWIFGNLGPENIIDGLKKQRDEKLFAANSGAGKRNVMLDQRCERIQGMMKVKWKKNNGEHQPFCSEGQHIGI